MSIDPLRDHEAVQLSRSQSLVGADGRALRREHAAGTATRLRRGVYASSDMWRALDDRRRHLMRMRAVIDTRSGDAVFGFESAAAVCPFGVTTLDAGLARSALDTEKPVDAETLRAELLGRLGELGAARGTRRAREAIGFASALSGSPGESASRVTIHLCRFPPPVLQFPVLDRNGTLWHADFGWPELRMLGEFDGYTKYTRNEHARGQPIEEIVWAEKKREDLMRGQGYGMARWLWDAALRAPLLTEALREGGLRPTA